MNNKLSKGFDKNFSDNVNNFNLCDNPFISNGGSTSRETVTNVLFNNKEANDNSGHSQFGNLPYQTDTSTMQNAFFEKQIDKLNKSAFSKNQREFSQHPMLNRAIKDNSFKHFLLVNRLYQSEEYDMFKSRFDKVRQRINITMGIICFYSMYILMNVYESKMRIYETTADLISNKKTFLTKINYKMHFAVMLPLIGILYYLKGKRQIVDDEFEKVVKEKYFDETIDYNYVKVSLR
jgi:hypothetical protein